MGVRGSYGFYEAVDFTPARIQEGEDFALVRAYMAHHQGMTIVAIANALFDGAMRARFHAEPIIQATELLLQERVPREVPSNAALGGRSPFRHASRRRGSHRRSQNRVRPSLPARDSAALQ